MAAATAPAETDAQTVTLVTQTRVLPGKDGEFAAWQQRVSAAVAAFPGVIDHNVIEPAPPTQQDWVIVQRFRSAETAQAWLESEERRRLLAEAEPMLAGQDDVHVFRGGTDRPADATVAAVISTRVAPEQEQAFRDWRRRIAAAEATFPGYLGSKVEPPIPGAQEDWATVVRFDSDEHLRAWLTSPERGRLLEEAKGFGAQSDVRTLRGGFDGWFNFGDRAGAGRPPTWKYNMVVLLVLYPVVFLFGEWVFDPLMIGRGMPFWLALFVAKVISVVLIGYFLQAPVDRALSWWLTPGARASRRNDLAGVGLVVFLYAVALGVFSLFP